MSMRAVTWSLAGLAALVGAAGLWYAAREPAPTAAPAPTAVAALSLPRPVAAPPVQAQAAAATIASQPLAAQGLAPPRIGSEGYGPHIERALAGGDAGKAWEAVRWLQSCATTEQRRVGAEAARAQGVTPEVMTRLMEAADEEARRCQTVTGQHRAMLPELAARAMHAGLHDAAATYAGAVAPADLTPAQRLEVTDAMRRDALAGFPDSLLGGAMSEEAWGFSDEEKLSYLYAYGELYGRLLGAKATVKALLAQGAIHFKTPPAPAQLAAGQLAGQQLVERVRAAQPD